MNNIVREYLIQAARAKEKFVFYSDVVKDCELDFDLSNEYGQHQLSVVLGEVSEFENKHKRPLLSAMAIYKDEKKNDHGDGFYKLAQSLGKGKIKQLRDELYAFEEANACREFWQNDKNYQLYFKIAETTAPANEPEFFTLEEIDFFKKWQYKSYDPKQSEHVNAKNKLMNTVWNKSIYLGKQIVDRLSGFHSEGKKIWHQRGWTKTDGINVQAAIFKPYTWIKIYRNTDKGKDIFFTFGIDVYPETNAFVYKIDLQRTRHSNLDDKQIRLADTLIPHSAKWNTIPFDELLDRDWKSLIDMCVEFIRENLEKYDAITDALWGADIPSELFKNKLIFRDKPQCGKTELPIPKNTFEPIEIDFIKKAKEQKDLGDAGEELVKEYEIAELHSKGRYDLAKLVEIVKDGMGYDVISFDEFGAEKYIEVKTTTGNEYSPFYLSNNEVEFARSRIGLYQIYRIYKYDAESNFGEFFKISGELEDQLLFKPVSYQVFLKKE
ncbi:protein NO VEIN domain-containing protein [Pedobacter sp.]